MIKTLIIDDEPLARSIVIEYLQPYNQIHLSGECNDGFEGLKMIQEHQPELIFLDIQMPKINGFELLELLENPPAVIFTTAYDAYAIKAFETHAVDYLLKPFSKERFDKAVEKFLAQTHLQENLNNTKNLLETTALSPRTDRVVVKVGNKIQIIPTSNILYLEAADDYVKIITKEGHHLKNKTMGYFESTLSADLFVRTHRSYILNVQEITRIDAHEKDSYLAILRSGAKIPVSKTGYAKLKNVLGL